jgi:conjugative transfer signal peptidase TraF
VLRTLIAARRRRAARWRIAAAATVAALPCLLTAAWRPSAAFVWNASASAPKGLYRLFEGEAPRRGDWVVAWLPKDMRGLAASRGYLPLRVPLVKRVAAVRGDRVCAKGSEVRVNGRLAAVRRAIDARGRPLPDWQGCVLLSGGDAFLLGTHPWSFDGRYFGITGRADITGRAVLLWRA